MRAPLSIYKYKNKRKRREKNNKDHTFFLILFSFSKWSNILFRIITNYLFKKQEKDRSMLGDGKLRRSVG